MDKLKRHPGYPVLFYDAYGIVRHGVTDGKEGECWRIIEVNPAPECENDPPWIVPPDYVIFDPEFHEEETVLDNLGNGVFALPVLVAGCIAAWVGLFMIIQGQWDGVAGFLLFGCCFYWAYLLVGEDEE